MGPWTVLKISPSLARHLYRRVPFFLWNYIDTAIGLIPMANRNDEHGSNNNCADKLRAWENPIRSKVQFQKDISRLSTLRMPAIAEAYIEPDSEEELRTLLQFVRRESIPIFILGRGSNTLLAPRIEGLVISMARFQDMRVDGNLLHAGAGVPNSKAIGMALRHDLSGLEFAIGIPGDVGGAVVMNANYATDSIENGLRALGISDANLTISKVVRNVRVMTEGGEVRILAPDALAFAYRESLLQHKPWIVLGVTFELKKRERTESVRVIQFMRASRAAKESSPVRSLGCVFRPRDPSYVYQGQMRTAAWLLEQSGAASDSEGDVRLDTVFANHIVNTGSGTQDQYLVLARRMAARVYKKFGIRLIPEIKSIPTDYVAHALLPPAPNYSRLPNNLARLWKQGVKLLRKALAKTKVKKKPSLNVERRVFLEAASALLGSALTPELANEIAALPSDQLTINWTTGDIIALGEVTKRLEEVRTLLAEPLDETEKGQRNQRYLSHALNQLARVNRDTGASLHETAQQKGGILHLLVKHLDQAGNEVCQALGHKLLQTPEKQESLRRLLRNGHVAMTNPTIYGFRDALEQGAATLAKNGLHVSPSEIDAAVTEMAERGLRVDNPTAGGYIWDWLTERVRPLVASEMNRFLHIFARAGIDIRFPDNFRDQQATHLAFEMREHSLSVASEVRRAAEETGWNAYWRHLQQFDNHMRGLGFDPYRYGPTRAEYYTWLKDPGTHMRDRYAETLRNNLASRLQQQLGDKGLLPAHTLHHGSAARKWLYRQLSDFSPSELQLALQDTKRLLAQATSHLRAQAWTPDSAFEQILTPERLALPAGPEESPQERMTKHVQRIVALLEELQDPALPAAQAFFDATFTLIDTGPQGAAGNIRFAVVRDGPESHLRVNVGLNFEIMDQLMEQGTNNSVALALAAAIIIKEGETLRALETDPGYFNLVSILHRVASFLNPGIEELFLVAAAHLTERELIGHYVAIPFLRRWMIQSETLERFSEIQKDSRVGDLSLKFASYLDHWTHDVVLRIMTLVSEVRFSHSMVFDTVMQILGYFPFQAEMAVTSSDFAFLGDPDYLSKEKLKNSVNSNEPIGPENARAWAERVVPHKRELNRAA